METVTCSVTRAALAEYLAAEILELAGNAARDNKKQRITPRFVALAIHSDPELRDLFKQTSIINGGIPPNIVPRLLPGKKRRPSKKRKKAATEDSADSAREEAG